MDLEQPRILESCRARNVNDQMLHGTLAASPRSFEDMPALHS